MLPVFQKAGKSHRWFLRRRRLVIMAAVLCGFFLLYQIISFMQLDWDDVGTFQNAPTSDDFQDMLEGRFPTPGDPAERPEVIRGQHAAPILDARENVLPPPKAIPFKADLLTTTTTTTTEQTIAVDALDTFQETYVAGVPKQYLNLYQNTSASIFKCFRSREELNWTMVNDDYCDCGDGTDEPSTNACPDNQFYCKNMAFDGREMIHSSRVNDGICDCCGGDDEWNNVPLPFPLDGDQLEVVRRSGSKVYHTPCVDRCSAAGSKL